MRNAGISSRRSPLWACFPPHSAMNQNQPHHECITTSTSIKAASHGALNIGSHSSGVEAAKARRDHAQQGMVGGDRWRGGGSCAHHL